MEDCSLPKSLPNIPQLWFHPHVAIPIKTIIEPFRIKSVEPIRCESKSPDLRSGLGCKTIRRRGRLSFGIIARHACLRVEDQACTGI
jgi:hypothetical protein